MKNFIFSIISFLVSQSVLASQLALVGGRPDTSLDFVKNILEGSVDLTPGEDHEVDWTTAVFSLLSARGIQKVTELEILAADGSGKTSDFMRAIEQASDHAPIVLTSIGPESEVQCEIMASHAQTVYVLPAGGEAAELSFVSPLCEARNILRVGALNESLASLAPFSNYGVQTVYIAAPGQNISVIQSGGRQVRLSGTTFAAAAVAAELAKFNTDYPEYLEWNGAVALVEAFFNEKTAILESLATQIRDGRVLK